MFGLEESDLGMFEEEDSFRSVTQFCVIGNGLKVQASQVIQDAASTAKVGLGVFVTRFCKKNEIITLYDGELIRRSAMPRFSPDQVSERQENAGVKLRKT